MQSIEGTPWDVPVPRNVIFIKKENTTGRVLLESPGEKFDITIG
jgi:hypothetical protein